MTLLVGRVHSTTSLDPVVEDRCSSVDDRYSGFPDVRLDPVSIHDHRFDAKTRECSLLRWRDCSRHGLFLLLPEVEVSVEQRCLRAKPGVVERQHHTCRWSYPILRVVDDHARVVRNAESLKPVPKRFGIWHLKHESTLLMTGHRYVVEIDEPRTRQMLGIVLLTAAD